MIGKISDFFDCYTLPIDADCIIKQIFTTIGFDKVSFSFSNDIIRVDEKQEVSMSLLIQIQD